MCDCLRGSRCCDQGAKCQRGASGAHSRPGRRQSGLKRTDTGLHKASQAPLPQVSCSQLLTHPSCCFHQPLTLFSCLGPAQCSQASNLAQSMMRCTPDGALPAMGKTVRLDAFSPAAGSCCPSVGWLAVSAGEPWTALQQMQVLQSLLRSTLGKLAPQHWQVPGGCGAVSRAAADASGRIAGLPGLHKGVSKMNCPCPAHAGVWSGRHTRQGMPPGCRSARKSGAQVSCPVRQPEQCTPAAAPCCTA